MSQVTCHMSHITCPVSRVMCHMIRVTCHMSCVTCNLVLFIFYKVLKLIGGGSVVNGAYPSSFQVKAMLLQKFEVVVSANNYNFE